MNSPTYLLVYSPLHHKCYCEPPELRQGTHPHWGKPADCDCRLEGSWPQHKEGHYGDVCAWIIENFEERLQCSILYDIMLIRNIILIIVYYYNNYCDEQYYCQLPTNYFNNIIIPNQTTKSFKFSTEHNGNAAHNSILSDRSSCALRSELRQWIECGVSLCLQPLRWKGEGFSSIVAIETTHP